MTDEFDQLRSIRHNLLHDAHRERLRIGLRIVNGELDLEPSVVHTPESLRHLHRFGVRAATMIEPSNAMEARGLDATNLVRIDATEVVRLNDQRIAVPSANRVAVPERLRLAEWWQRAAVHVDRAQPVVRFVDDENLRRRLDDLQRLWVDVVLKKTLRETQAVRIVQTAFRGAHLLQVGGPGLERQPSWDSRASTTSADHPNPGQIRLPIGGPWGWSREIGFAIGAFRHADRMERPLRVERHRKRSQKDRKTSPPRKTASSLPHPRDRLAHEIVRIRALLRPELLHAPAVHFGDVEVALLIDAHAVHAPQRAGEHAERAPRVEQVALAGRT